MSGASAIVLCGGRSSRMGRAKAWLPWQGRTMVAHVVEVLSSIVDDVVVVAAPDQDLPRVNARVVRDAAEGLGPLAGIAMGLSHVQGDLAYVTATDAPHLTPHFVEQMLRHGKAAAPEVAGFVQTLSAVYPSRAAAKARALLAEGRRRPLDLLEALDFLTVTESELADTRSVEGFNTPDAYLAAVRAVSPKATAVLELMGRARVAAGLREMEVPVGPLRDVLAHVGDRVDLLEGDRVARPYSVSIDGRCFVRDARVPIGPGEHAVVLDASVGG